MIKIYPFILLIFSSLPQKIHAQNSLGSWNILSTKTTFTDKWGAFLEGQIRSLKFYNDFHYYEIKGGVSYSLDKNFTFAIAGGKYDTYREGGNFVTPKTSDEIRLFEQLSISQSLYRLLLDHRYRIEQRFTQNGYKNRFRYKLQVVIPLNKHKIEPNTWYLSTSGEIFFTDTPTYFERLRFFIGAGYQFSKSWGVQSGYLYQFDYKLTDETGRDFFQLSLLWNIQLKHKGQEKVPSQID